MSEQVTQGAAGPREKRRRRIVQGTFGASVLVGLVVGVIAEVGSVEPIGLIRDHPWIVPGMLAAAMPALLWSCLWYWRAIDELARQAHLDAWFWGGSTGMSVALICLAFAPQVPAAWSFGLLQRPVPEALLYGGLVTFGGGLVGYGLVWAAFWLRRR